ncbi:MAG: DegQ family serine endoprotease [Thiobacillaceae bacterium]|nr:DegQ family serine endoprotease [Thiobacillaceae bacterium]MCX7673566.1 DegQ family serine endoprotease [Thiobacillaceae bacterium]MDW8323414.1 DegQ family serine endoprotease [Burkholderiales bacterium]
MRFGLIGLILTFFAAVATAAQLPDFTELVERQAPAVVNITTVQDARRQRRGRMPQPDELFEFFRRFAPPEGGERFTPPRRGQGSGFIISDDGYILTNTHVVDEADEVIVRLHDRREFRAKVVGKDERTDVALIKIEARGLPRVTIGDPERLKVGEWVLAIGAPFGFENSVTAGIVSAKGRSLPSENYVPFIQTDVAVNPGNSGGPLFNMRGEVVGINSQIISRSGGYMGLSFAIPIDVAMDVAEQLKTTGRVARGRIGVMIQEVTNDLAESFGLAKPQGALVSEVEKGSPAERAGVQVSDIILRYNGRPVERSIDLPRMVGATRPGTKATLTVWRKGRTLDLTVTVGEMPVEKVAGARPEAQPDRAGLITSDLTPEQRRQLNIQSGVLVEDVTGAAARAGVRPGDVILAVNNREVYSSEELSKLINETGRKSVALLVKRGESSIYIPLRLD